MGGPTQRLFLALWPDEAVRERLAAIAPRLNLADGRIIPPENLHITLAFLGAVEVSRRFFVEQAVSEVSVVQFELTLAEVRWRRRSGMLWLNARESPSPLIDLVARLRQLLAGGGFAVERRPYRSHVTLARDVTRAPANWTVVPPIVWTVRDLCLVSSRVTSSGSRYTIERRWELSATGNV